MEQIKKMNTNESDELNEKEISDFRSLLFKFLPTSEIEKYKKKCTRICYNLIVKDIKFVPDKQNNEHYGDECYLLGRFYAYECSEYDPMGKHRQSPEEFEEVLRKDNERMKKYYYKAIGAGNIDAMVALAYYYQSKEVSHKLMREFLAMAAENGDICSMKELGYYYRHSEYNYKLMKKYYKMAIKKGDIDAKQSLKRNEKEIENVIKKQI
jgi:TPR repeat protein